MPYSDRSPSNPAVSEMIAMTFFSSWEIEALTFPKKARLSYPKQSFALSIRKPLNENHLPFEGVHRAEPSTINRCDSDAPLLTLRSNDSGFQ
jgi:hypothetical protein